MKTKRVAVFLLPILLTVTTTFASFDVNLRSGAKGAEVTKVQKFLIQKGLLDTTIFGNFGPLTLKAVKQYQKNNNLPMTGYVGPMTREIMNADISGGSGVNSTTQTQQTSQAMQNIFSADKTNAKVGDIITVELKVSATSDHPIYSVGATINFDPKIVTLIDGTLDGKWMPLSQDPYWITDNVSGNIVRTAGFSGGLRGTQTFVTYRFKAIAKGAAKISLSKGISMDFDNNDFGMEGKTITVTIK